MTVLYHIEKKILMMRFAMELNKIANMIKKEKNYYAAVALVASSVALCDQLKFRLSHLVEMNRKVLFKKGSISTVNFKQGEFVIPESKHGTLNIYMQHRINTDKDFVNKLRDKIRGMQK